MSQPEPPTAPLAPPPAPADIGLVAALPIEIAPFLAKLNGVRKYSSEPHTIVEGELAGKLVAAIIAGTGRAAARKGTSLLLAGHRPRWVVSAGFAGALDPGRKRNDVILPTEVLAPEGTSYAIGLTLDDSARSPVSTGRLVTVDAIVRTAAEKAELRRRTSADVVDMETSAVAALCAERGIRLLAVRVVSDEADIDLPPEILSILGPTGGFRLGAALGAIWRRPSSLKDLWGLREHAHVAAERLATVLPGILARLS